MDGLGIGVLIALIIGLASVVLYGFVTAVTAFHLAGDRGEPPVPPSQVIRGPHSPLYTPRRGRRITVRTRQLVTGLVCMVVAGLWLLGILAVADH